jgi:hypothetical protein
MEVKTEILMELKSNTVLRKLLQRRLRLLTASLINSELTERKENEQEIRAICGDFKTSSTIA